MARKRDLNPDRWTTDAVLGISWGAGHFLAGISNFADDEGRIVWSSRQLWARICPRPDVSLADVEGWMAEIERAGLWVPYRVDDVTYAFDPRWDDQYINRPQRSKLPAPSDANGDPVRVLHLPFTEDSVSIHGTFSERSCLARARARATDPDSDPDSGERGRTTDEPVSTTARAQAREGFPHQPVDNPHQPVENSDPFLDDAMDGAVSEWIELYTQAARTVGKTDFEITAEVGAVDAVCDRALAGGLDRDTLAEALRRCAQKPGARVSRIEHEVAQIRRERASSATPRGADRAAAAEAGLRRMGENIAAWRREHPEEAIRLDAEVRRREQATAELAARVRAGGLR